MPDFRRGTAEIQKATEAAKTGGEFKPFLPAIYWEPDDNKYVMFLNPIEEVPLVKLHPYIDLPDGKFDSVIARTDASIGESADPIEKQWKYAPRESNIAVAVELEPLIEVVNERPRPRGFEVKTVTFERRIRDADGELTDDREDCTAPVIGVVTQSPHNFFNLVSSFDANNGPIESTPVKISRIGKKTNTVYNIEGYVDQEVDLSNLIEFIDGISYLTSTEMETLLQEVDEVGDDFAAAVLIGQVLLDKRLEELADEEHYNAVLGAITQPSKYATKEKKSATKTERPARRSQRRQTQTEEAPEAAPETPVEEAKPKTQRRSRTRKNTEEGTKAAPAQQRLAELRARAEEVAQSKTKGEES